MKINKQKLINQLKECEADEIELHLNGARLWGYDVDNASNMLIIDAKNPRT